MLALTAVFFFPPVVVGPVRDRRPDTACRGQPVQTVERVAGDHVPDAGAARQGGRVRPGGRGHRMRARAVHAAGHHNGGQTVGGQRDRADDAVSYVTVTVASPARACPTTNINAGSPDSCVCVCVQARVERVAPMGGQGEPPPEEDARQAAGHDRRNAQAPEAMATRLSARRHRAAGPVPGVLGDGYIIPRTHDDNNHTDRH